MTDKIVIFGKHFLTSFAQSFHIDHHTITLHSLARPFFRVATMADVVILVDGTRFKMLKNVFGHLEKGDIAFLPKILSQLAEEYK